MKRKHVDRATPHAPSWSDEAGFGLVEAMVAIMVLAVGLLAVAGITLAVASQSRASTYTTEQTMVGQEVLDAKLHEGYADLTAGTTDSTVQVDSRRYDVQIVVTDVGARARRVSVTVGGMENTDQVSLTSFAHQPRDVPEEYTP